MTHEVTYTDFQLQVSEGDTVRRSSDGREVTIHTIVDLDAAHNYSNLQDYADKGLRTQMVEEFDEPEDALTDEYLAECFEYGTPGICRMVTLIGERNMIPLTEIVPLNNIQPGDRVGTPRGEATVMGYAKYLMNTMVQEIEFDNEPGRLYECEVDSLVALDG